MKRIAILGSTGSIGCKALQVIEAGGERYKVVALAAGRNIDLLAKQIDEFRPLGAALLEQEDAKTLRNRLNERCETQVFYGTEGFCHLVTLPEVDTVISAMSGAAGLVPTYQAIKAGKEIALANKETLVIAGSVIMAEAKKQELAILPIDSEHSAILQSLQGHHKEDVRQVILTASGGPLRESSQGEMEKVTPEQALRHPNWNMGTKITIDSATLMNKGLEAIEAKWLFDLNIDQISILIHPQSIVHSMVEYKDGSIIAQLGIPDMATPISYALSYPRHLESMLPRLRLEEIGTLSFIRPDMKKFKCLDLALKAAQIGESMPAVLSGANEVAVELFLKGKILFTDIAELVEKTMDAHRPYPLNTIEEAMGADSWSRIKARELAGEFTVRRS
ncbi:MAG: 1-deoxy-D-xylulose-5-phosphate reductoisomerase [Deltaproteobacteria bacterium]|nr:1-deoxy-D-xylulose-5-phosphate reductoisomerase [Deltaproteobacteria bacterium]MBW1935442.1 1-deoxy-D-xylulose-5-phosphate reductoisomerase [Deltaproteobacteria bacterium]